MKILLIASTLIPKNGWGTFALGMAQGLKDAGHDVHVLTNEVNTAVDVPQSTGLPPPLTLLDSSTARLKAWTVINAKLLTFRPDITHVLLEPYGLAMSTITKPWVMNLHGTYGVLPLSMPHAKATLLKAYKNAKGLLAASDYTLSRVREAVKKQSGEEKAMNLVKKTRILTLGIDASALTLNTSSAGGPRRILFVGEVKPRKGVKELIEACGALKRISKTPFHLDLAGKLDMEDPYVAELRTRIAELGLKESVTFHGQVDDDTLNALYAKADLFSMLSISYGDHFEGFGLVFLEANARGIPTIGSLDSGCKEAIDDGKSGYAVPADKPELIAERMKWILEEGRIKPADCRAWAEAHSIERQARECIATYESVIHHP